MGVCSFDTTDLRRLIGDAKAATEFDMGYENDTDEALAELGLPPITNRTPAGPAILFVHDSGVYLMSNNRMRGQPVAYAEGCNPNIGAFDDWYQTSRELVGGDDFVEILPIQDDWLPNCALYSKFLIHVNAATLDYSFSTPKVPATVTQITAPSPVAVLNLSVRCRKCLKALGIDTVYQLTQHTEKELLAAKNFGAVSLAEVKEKLRSIGLTLFNPQRVTP